MAFQSRMISCVFIVLLLGVTAEAASKLSELNHTLSVTVTSKPVVQAGTDHITINWKKVNETKFIVSKLELLLCYGAPSQVERGWRKSNDIIAKDKGCQYEIQTLDYTDSGSFDYLVNKDIPFAQYYVRAYGSEGTGEKVIYGQSTNANRTTNLFTVEPITGRHASIDIAAGVFSAFSVFSLFGFYFYEKHQQKKSQA